MRVRDFANAVNMEMADAAIEVQTVLGMGSTPHVNSSLKPDQVAKLAEKYPQISGVDQGDGPVEEGEGDGTVSVAAQPENIAPVLPSPPMAPAVPSAPTVPMAPAAPSLPPSSPTRIVPQSETPRDNVDPESRKQVARDAVSRQFLQQPRSEESEYLVSYPGEPEVKIAALSENEAWAKYCDQNQSWPSPRMREVKKIA